MRDQNQDLLFRQMTAYETRTRAELLAEAKRPVESLSDEYVERLVGRMVEANRFTFGNGFRFNL